jgi:CheY-specific phosphatase CheX
MIESSMHQALADSVREVLGKMFYVNLSDDAADAGRGPGSEALAARLIFDGDPPGSFRLDLDVTLAQRAAAGFLYEDPAELTREQIHDVICELANMICGSALSRIESTATFRLAKPEIAAPQTRFPAALLGASFQASMGGGALRAEIRMERPVCCGTDEPVF